MKSMPRPTSMQRLTLTAIAVAEKHFYGEPDKLAVTNITISLLTNLLKPIRIPRS